MVVLLWEQRLLGAVSLQMTIQGAEISTVIADYYTAERSKEDRTETQGSTVQESALPESALKSGTRFRHPSAKTLYGDLYKEKEGHHMNDLKRKPTSKQQKYLQTGHNEMEPKKKVIK